MKRVQVQLEMVAALLREQTCLALATTGENGEASVAPLFYIVDSPEIGDERLSLCWLSAESSLHSLNLLRTPRAAATVFRNTGNWREIRGVQMRGPVSQVTEPARRRALIKAYCERFKLRTVFRLAIRQSALYALQPDFYRYIDNSRGFGYKFELRRGREGWVCTGPNG